jgi:4-hydroxy-tetrahydrodipicolinate synthase
MQLRGIIPVLATPFHADESIDEEYLRREVDFCIERGAAALCTPAFGSEYYKLSDQERLTVARIAVSQCQHRIPMIVNVGMASVRSTLEFCHQAESMGAEGVMVAVPRAVPLGGSELRAYFEQVCQAVSLPVMIQDVDFTGAGLPLDLLLELAKRCPNLRSVKLENPLPGAKCKELIRLSSGRVSVFYGWAGLRFFDGMAHGASGFMPGAGSVDVYATIMRLYDSGKVEDAKAFFYRLLPYLVFALESMELLISMEKRLLVKRGVIPSGRLREPTLHLDDEYEEQAEEMANLVVSLTKDLPVGS